ncbi:ribose 5-phosphate isomerase A, partial [Escherichia coli]|nr:ribose 5-phosphate isomerase A [Escherichia coli]
MSEDAIKQMKQAVAKAAADRVQSGMIVGLGTGSTTAFVIQFLGDRLRKGELSHISG